MLKGVFTLVKYKAVQDENGEWVPGEIVSVQEEQNNIQYRVQDGLMRDDANQHLSIGDDPVAYVSALPLSNMLNTTRSTTFWVQGGQQSAPTLTGGDYNTDPTVDAFWTAQTRFSVPGATRYIRSVVLGHGNTSNSNDVYWYTQTPCCVTLTTPCIQETDEILDIFYRVFSDVQPVKDGKTDSYLRMAYDYGLKRVITPTNSGTPTPSDYMSYYPTNLWFEQTKADSIGRFNAVSVYTGGSIRDNSYSSNLDHILGHRYAVSIPATSANVQAYHGLPIRALAIKNSNRYITVQPVSKGTGSSIQNTYHRSVDDGSFRRPFLDIDNLGASQATVTVTDPGTWADAVSREPFVHQYRIEITTGGLVGTAEYKIRHRRGTGWDSALYHPMPITMPTMMSPAYADPNERVTELNPTRHGQYQRRVQQYLWPEFLTHNVGGITFMHVNGEFENLDADSTIPLNVTDLLQVAPAWSGGERTGDVFVACGDTGLWKVERPSEGPVTAVTQITPAGITNPNSCRAVTVNRSNGDVWAIFHDITDAKCYMAHSTDQGVNWT